ncbi:MAG: hypothetical protein KJO69_05450 [Gammaproteobacteria bacterium]|nr:hypothetical protein [Gammaproteobacteria bacterium]
MKALLFALLLPLSALADTVEVTFTPPIEREDGTLLPITDIQNYQVYVNGAPDITIPNTDNIGEIVLAPGLYDISVTTLDTDGRESAPSNVVSVQAKSPPGNPANLIIKILRK